MGRLSSWTEDEENALIKMAEKGMTLKEIYESGKIKKHYTTISKKKGELGYNQDLRKDFKPYSDEDLWNIWILRQKGSSKKEIADKLERPIGGLSFIMTRHRLVYQQPNVPIPEKLIPIVEELEGDAK